MSEIERFESARPNKRRHELDWLRVLAFGLLIFYHIGMYYVQGWGWHYKSLHQSDVLHIPMLWSNQWRMSLLFLVSGSALAYMLLSMSARRFYISRLSNLLLPLIFGIAVVVVPQVYVEAQSNGHIGEGYSYFRFWYAYLDQNSALFEEHKTLASFHITWNHLWFLVYIFFYSLLAWNIFHFISFLRRRKVYSSISKSLAPVYVVFFIPILYLTINHLAFYGRFPRTHAFIDDFYNHGRYFYVFAFGMLVVFSQKYWLYIGKCRFQTFFVGILCFSTLLVLRRFDSHHLSALAKDMLVEANAWFWLLSICGWGQAYLNQKNPVIQYLNKGVYCYYILHQSLIIVFAYCLRDYKLGPVLEPLVLICLTITGCGLGFEFLKRIPYLRIFFGIFIKSR